MNTEEKELTPAEAREISGGYGLIDQLVDAVVDYIKGLAKPTV